MISFALNVVEVCKSQLFVDAIPDGDNLTSDTSNRRLRGRCERNYNLRLRGSTIFPHWARRRWYMHVCLINVGQKATELIPDCCSSNKSVSCLCDIFCNVNTYP